LAVTSPKFEIIIIDGGSWSLEKFAISPLAPQIAYNTSGLDNFINIYDIPSRKVIKKVVADHLIWNFSWSSKNQIAYISRPTKGSSILIGNNFYFDHELHVLQLKN
jgi:hypothetical protein